MPKKTIRVVAAFIEHDGLVFAAKRDYGDLKGKWEFPGGKIEEGEAPKEAIKREIKEELNTEIEVESFLLNEQYDYPTFHLDMDVFKCKVISGKLNPIHGIHSEDAWFKKDELLKQDWCPADKEIVKKLLESIRLV